MTKLSYMLMALLLFSIAAPMRAQNLFSQPDNQVLKGLFGLTSPTPEPNVTTWPISLLGWQKITGERWNYSGVADGIDGDRENSYLWSAEFHGGYLYVGTSRDIVGLVMTLLKVKPANWPASVPFPSDLRGRIYRMCLATGKWDKDPFYVANELATVPLPTGNLKVGPDVGYRIMKTFTAKRGKPVLYVGSAGLSLSQNLQSSARLLAIDADNNQPEVIFTAPGFSVRTITEYNQQLFWASEENGAPKIWYSSDPLKAYDADHNVKFASIDVPSGWFPYGAEILDMVSWNNALYVFFFDHDFDHGGFWCAKLQQDRRGNWNWTLIVGDQSKGAKYPKGMGRMENGGATPFVFKDKMYVGTISNTMWAFLMAQKEPTTIPPTGTQLFRFDTNDKWERVMPPKLASGTLEEGLNGFANPLNLYLWRFAVQNGKLYAGTFDASIAFGGSDLLEQLNLWNPSGFDLYSTYDGKLWFPESLDGFGDQWNYGARVLITNPDNGDLYLGTANPFYGCQVWRKKASLW